MAPKGIFRPTDFAQKTGSVGRHGQAKASANEVDAIGKGLDHKEFVYRKRMNIKMVDV